MPDSLNGHVPAHESWRYILRVMEDETILFKTKLAHILSDNFERSHLKHLEVFQHRFLKMDEQISLLRHEVRDLQEAMLCSNEQTTRPVSVTILQKMLTEKMDRIQSSFDILASDFQLYLKEHFPSS
ncbi:hypothetical protein PV783_13195 [Chitinophaga sp. CC14]|uniref:hypothetical protein n=1 Tax=Chitinophaga TaxID=79328 RepID=UPI000DB9CFAA|nr:hypothetical protein [Chitinophaga ginsengisegetis]MDR6568233.1 putative transcriptional regulator [Chitinophaga ginsengisegetis]MDR6648536.1 putative transcriptional regulator [Chitinophaga ginsengisegetis]MDR6654314.1 putative transcriptional regulator [Chitinophaga ginsengisegetis]